MPCGKCPISKEKGVFDCRTFRTEYPDKVLEILKQQKKENEKKETETEFTWCVLIIEADTHILKHEEKVGTDFKSIDAKKRQKSLRNTVQSMMENIMQSASADA